MKILRRGLAYPAVLVAIFLFVHAGLATLPLYDDEVWTIAHAEAILKDPIKPRVILWGESSTLSDWGKRPVWEYTYAALIYVFGQSLLLMRISKMAVGLAVILLIYEIAKKVYDRNVAFLAALLIVLNPFFIRESWFNGGYDLQMSMLYLAGLFLAIRKRYELAGLALGLAVLTKETALLFLPPLLFFVFLSEKKPLSKFLRSREFLQIAGIPLALVSVYYLFDYLRYGFFFGGAESTKIQLLAFKPLLLNSLNLLGSLTMHISLVFAFLFFVSVFRPKRIALAVVPLLSIAFLALYPIVSGMFENFKSFLPLTPDMALTSILFVASFAYVAATRRKPFEIFIVLGIIVPILPFVFTKHQFARYYLPVFYLAAILLGKELITLFYGVGKKWRHLLLLLLFFSFAYEFSHANAYNLFYQEEHKMSGALSTYLLDARPDILIVDSVQHLSGLYDRPVKIVYQPVDAAENTTGEFYRVTTGYSAGPANCKTIFEYGYATQARLLNDPLAAISQKSLLSELGLRQKSTVFHCAKA